MEQIPAKIVAPYEVPLFDKEIPRLDHPYYKKWLQNNQLQRQASDAISLYYEIELSNSRNKIATRKKYYASKLKKDRFELTNADWTSVYNDLDAEIKSYIPHP